MIRTPNAERGIYKVDFWICHTVWIFNAVGFVSIPQTTDALVSVVNLLFFCCVRIIKGWIGYEQIFGGIETGNPL